MYSYSSYGLVPWELFSLLLVPWDRGKLGTEVFGTPEPNGAGDVF